MQQGHRQTTMDLSYSKILLQSAGLTWSCLQLANTTLLEWHPMQNEEPQRKILQLLQGLCTVLPAEPGRLTVNLSAGRIHSYAREGRTATLSLENPTVIPHLGCDP